MPKADLGDVEIYYEIHGEEIHGEETHGDKTRGAATPVLLVPGLGGVGSYWSPNLPAFSERYQVIVHDHRGCGQSSRSRIRYSVDQMADDLLRLMDHLEVGEAHLVGHSTGGAIGQRLAATHPGRFKSLVISGSWMKADAFFRRVFEARRTLLTAAGAAAYVRASSVFLYPAWWVNENIGLLEERERVGIPAFPATEIATSRIDAILEFDGTADLGRITIPTLVICAKDDMVTPHHFSRELAAKIAQAELVLLERGGHCASETSRSEYDAAVLGFIGRHA